MNRLSIAIAEDSKVVRAAIQSLLSNSGYFDIVGTATNGKEALQLVRDAKPQVVLLDVSMPEMNGIEAARQICALAPDSIIIMLSSHDEMDVIREALKAGARDFIRKPVHGPELIQKILTIFNREGSRRQVSADSGRKKVLAFMGPKSGVGATTVACNTAVVLHRKLQKKVLMVDLDFLYSDVSHCMGGKREASLQELLKAENNHQAPVIERFVINTGCGVHLLAGPGSPAPEAMQEETVATILRGIEPSYDYIVLDMVPNFSERTGRILEGTDQLLLVISNDVPAIRSGKVCLEHLKKLKYPMRKVRVVFNHVAAHGGVDRGDLQDFINFPIFAETQCDRENVTKAYLARSPFATKSELPLVKDLEKLVESLFVEQDRF